MAQLKLLYGQNLKVANPAFDPGTLYVDIATGEMWFDDPSSSVTTHAKIIDNDTLLFEPIGELIDYPSTNVSGATTAKLGTAILGTMVLGAE